MIPSNAILTESIVITEHPDRTYLCVTTEEESSRFNVYRSRVSGFCDGVEALKQTVYFILSTERYVYPIYSWDYGVELRELVGKPMSYVMSELPRRITEALTMDDRISNATNFSFERHGRRLAVSFTVVSDIAELETGLEVTV